MQALPLHLEPGSDVRLSLERFGREQGGHGFVLSVVGNLSQAAFQCPGTSAPTVLSGELEIITLQGTLSPSGVHLHLSFSDSECRVWGGHLEPGTLVFRGADLLVGLLPVPVADPATQPRVRIAAAPGCPYSQRALRMLRTLGIAHAQVDPPAGSSLPQVWIDGENIGGYDALAELHGQGGLEALRQPWA